MSKSMLSNSGDKFYQRGSYDEGMIYLSRMDKNKMKDMENTSTKKSETKTMRGDNKNSTREVTNSYEETSIEATRDMKLKCAESIYNLSSHENNESNMVNDGVMTTIHTLGKIDDARIKLYLSAALVNLSFSPEAQVKMVEEGAIQATLELSHTHDIETKQNCGRILLRLSSDDTFHFRLVQEGCALTLNQLLGSPCNELKEICLRALINLAAFPRGSMSDTIMSTLIHIAKLESQESHITCAKGLLNLSIMATTRATVVEDGAILALRILSGTATEEVHGYISCTLCNLAAVRTNQENMVKNGTLTIVNDLLELSIETINRQCASTLSYLSCNPRLRSRIVTSGFVVKLIKMLSGKCKETRRLATLSLSNLTAHYESRVRMVEDGTVAPLIRAMVSSKDLCIKQDCVVALCNLMSHPSTYKDMVDVGVVPAFISLSDADDVNIQRACALALLNLSYDASMQVKIVEQGVVASLINLTALPSLEIRKMCITTLYNLSQRHENAQCLLYEGCISVIVMLMDDEKLVDLSYTEIQREHCTAIMCNLSNFERGRMAMIEAGAIEALVQITKEVQDPSQISNAKDPRVLERISDTRVYAAGTLCNLCTVATATDSFFPTLLQLASAHDSKTTLRCSMAFSNLSSNENGRSLLSKFEDIAPGLNSMMRTGHHETQVNAAIALCNLSRERGPFDSVWKKGTVPDFIVIALLRINSQDTKEICAKVLFNLLSHDDTREQMLNEGVLYSLIKLAKLERITVRELCIRAMYNISLEEERIQHLLDGEVVRVLVGMYQNDFSRELKRLTCGILSNITSHAISNEMTLVSEGIFTILKQLMKVRDPETRAYMSTILCNLSRNEEVAVVMVKDELIPVLITLCKSENKDIRKCSTGTLCNISANADMHERMESDGVVPVIVEVLQRGTCSVTNNMCIKIVRNLCSSASLRKALVSAHAVRVLSSLVLVEKETELQTLCSEILCILGSETGVEVQVCDDGIIRALVSIANDTSKSIGKEEKPYCASITLLSVFRNLSICQECQTIMLDDGIMMAIVHLSGQDSKTLQRRYSQSKGRSMSAEVSVSDIPVTYNMDGEFSLECSILLRNLSVNEENGNRAKMTSQAGAIRTMLALALSPRVETKENLAITLYNLSCYRRSRGQIIALDGVKTIIRLSNSSSTSVKHLCALSLHSLSNHDSNIMQGGLVSTLSSLGELNSSAMNSTTKLATCLITTKRISELNERSSLHGVDVDTKLPGAGATWLSNEMSAPIMPAFSIENSEQDENDTATPPRQCAYDAVLGELEFLTAPGGKHKILHRQVVLASSESLPVIVTTVPEVNETKDTGEEKLDTILEPLKM